MSVSSRYEIRFPDTWSAVVGFVHSGTGIRKTFDQDVLIRSTRDRVVRNISMARLSRNWMMIKFSRLRDFDWAIDSIYDGQFHRDPSSKDNCKKESDVEFVLRCVLSSDRLIATTVRYDNFERTSINNSARNEKGARGLNYDTITSNAPHTTSKMTDEDVRTACLCMCVSARMFLSVWKYECFTSA